MKPSLLYMKQIFGLEEGAQSHESMRVETHDKNVQGLLVYPSAKTAFGCCDDACIQDTCRSMK